MELVLLDLRWHLIGQPDTCTRIWIEILLSHQGIPARNYSLLFTFIWDINPCSTVSPWSLESEITWSSVGHPLSVSSITIIASFCGRNLLASSNEVLYLASSAYEANVSMQYKQMENGKKWHHGFIHKSRHPTQITSTTIACSRFVFVEVCCRHTAWFWMPK